MGKFRFFEQFYDFIGEVVEGEYAGVKVGWGTKDPNYDFTFSNPHYEKALFFFVRGVVVRISDDDINSYDKKDYSDDKTMYSLNYKDGKVSVIVVGKESESIVESALGKVVS